MLVTYINIFMSTLIKPLHQVDNFDILMQEVSDIISNVGFEKNQIVCQHLEKNLEDWHTGIGRIEELDEKEEKNYSHIHPSLSGTVLESLILKYQGFRTRIMKLPPKGTYSVHADPTPRIHIPLVSQTSQNWMIWPYNNSCFRLLPGLVYWTDTTKNHTFVNCSDKDRIHIVMCVDK